MVVLDMVFEQNFPGEVLATQITDMWPLARVNLHVVLQVPVLGKPFTTHLHNKYVHRINHTPAQQICTQNIPHTCTTNMYT